MGIVCHHAIVVTSEYGDHIVRAHAKASEEMGDLVSPIIESRINGTRSFFIAPDGSKEGWDESDKGNEQRVTDSDDLAGEPTIAQIVGFNAAACV